MRADILIPSVQIGSAARARILTKYAIGEIVDISVKGEVMITPSGPVFIRARATLKEQRSQKEHRLYWALMSWLSSNTPEQLTRIVGPLSPASWHQLFKDSAGIESTAFDNLGQDDFHQYFDFIGRWLWERFEIILEDVIEYIKGIEG